MSTQLKEKQQTKSKEQVPNRELQADFHFNQHIFRTIAYTAAGFGFGMVSSLLFKHKAGMTIFFAGAGAGYGSADFVNELNNFRHKRNVTQINRREGGPSSQIREKLDRTADNLKGDFQQAKNKLERGTEDVAGKVAGQINQTARGAEEWARNASEKASQHFQKKDFRRGGDDDSDKDDTKSKKDQSQRKDQQKQDESLKRDQQKQAKEPERKDQKTSSSKDQPKDSKAVDRQKEFKDQSHTSKKDEKQSKEPERKDQKQQSKDQPKDLKSKDSKTNENRGEETEWNKTTKGGLSKEAAREAGSKEHRLKGDIRFDQFSSKAPDQEDFTGYNSPKQQWEGVKVKKEDKSTHGQGKGPSEENKTVNIKGQQFQDFHSNPNKLGASGDIHEIKKDYQRNRNKAEEKDLDTENRIRYVKHSQQDKHGESIRQGNIHDIKMRSETQQGFQNYQTGVAPAKQTNESNAKL